jgi:hypothetical protein
VKKITNLLFTGIILCCACSKKQTPNPVKTAFKITVKPSISFDVTSTWPQILGGEALITFTPVNADTLSVAADSLNLTNVGTFSKQVFAGTYNVTLNTKSKAITDTFIRFTSSVTQLAITQDQAISFPATTNDGVITINKTAIDTTVAPTFTVAGQATAVNFGKAANGYYFIYVDGNTTGRISFVDATTGYTYLKDITIAAMSQYDLSPVINKTDVIVRLSPFKPAAAIKKNNL